MNIDQKIELRRRNGQVVLLWLGSVVGFMLTGGTLQTLLAGNVDHWSVAQYIVNFAMGCLLMASALGLDWGHITIGVEDGYLRVTLGRLLPRTTKIGLADIRSVSGDEFLVRNANIYQHRFRLKFVYGDSQQVYWLNISNAKPEDRMRVLPVLQYVLAQPGLQKDYARIDNVFKGWFGPTVSFDNPTSGDNDSRESSSSS